MEARALENDVRAGGKFKTVMGAKDKSISFDFMGTYSAVQQNRLIEYDMSDGRHVKVEFADAPGGVKVTETFEPEKTLPGCSAQADRQFWIISKNMLKAITNSII